MKMVQPAAELVEKVFTRHYPWLTAAALVPVAIYVLGFFAFSLPNEAVMFGDSEGYLSFAVHRTLGYPLFIRFVAMVFDDPYAIILVQILIGQIGVIFFAEILQRVLKNHVVTILIGLFSMVNWPLLGHGMSILADYLFFSLLCFHFGIFLLLIQKVTIWRGLALALTVALAVSVRPVAIFLVGLVPLVFLVLPRFWRAILKGYVGGLVLFLGLTASLNYLVYDYFALSKFAGYNSAWQTMLLIREDTQTPVPALSRRLYERSKPFKARYDELKTDDDRVYFMMWESTILLDEVAAAWKEYLEENPAANVLSDVSRQQALLDFLNDLSDLNRAIGRGSGEGSDNWINYDTTLMTVTRSVFLAQPFDVFDVVMKKLVYNWKYFLIPAMTVPPDAKYIFLDPTIAELRTDQEIMVEQAKDGGLFGAWLINGAAKALYVLKNQFAGSTLILLAGFVISLSAVWFAVVKRDVPLRVAVLTYLFGAVFLSMATVCIAGIPLQRYSMAVIAATLSVCLSPVLIVNLFFESPLWRSR